MYRIDNSTAVGTIPTFPNPGTPGYFTNGNPNLAAAATIVDDWWLNQVQEELLAVIAFAGYTPDKNNRHQLLDSLNRLYTGVGATGNYLPLIGGTLRRPGGENILFIQTEPGRDNNIIMQIDGQAQWGIGPGSGGYFRIFNYTTGNNVFRIQQDNNIAEFPTTDIMLSRTQPLHYILRNGGTGIAFARSGGANMPEMVFAADNGRFQGILHTYRTRAYWPGSNDPLYLFADAGQNCLAHFQVAGGHEYGVGAGLDGSFYCLYDWTDNSHVLRYASGILYSGRELWSPAYTSTNFRVSDGGSLWALNGYISGAIVQGAAPPHANSISAMQLLSPQAWFASVYCYPGLEWISFNSQVWCNQQLHVQGYTSVSGNLDVGQNLAAVALNCTTFYSSASGVVGGGLTVNSDVVCQDVSARVVTTRSDVNVGANLHIHGAGYAWGYFRVDGDVFSTNGNFWSKGSLVTSDVRLKRDIEDWADGLEIVEALKPKRYRHAAGGPPQLGLIAQDVETVLPDAVASRDGVKFLNYTHITAALVDAVRQLSAKVDALERRA